MSYDWKITLKKFGEAAGMAMLLAGVTALAEGIESRATLGAIATGVGLALLRALQNYIKNIGKDGMRGPFDSAVMVLFVAGACLAFPGCMSLTPYGPGALSSNNVKVVESTAHAEGVDTFALEIKSRGDAAAKTSVKYTGEAEADETPWAFAVLGEANVESAERVKPLNEGAGAALAALPATLAPLVEVLGAVGDAPAGTPGAGVRDRIIAMIMERVFAAMGGGVR